MFATARLDTWELDVKRARVSTPHNNRSRHLLTTPPGGTPLYKPYRYVRAQRAWFLRRFGLK